MGKPVKFTNSDNVEIIIDEENIDYIDLHELIDGNYQVKATFRKVKELSDTETVVSKIFQTKKEAYRYLEYHDLDINYLVNDKTGKQVLQLYMDFDIV